MGTEKKSKQGRAGVPGRGSQRSPTAAKAGVKRKAAKPMSYAEVRRRCRGLDAERKKSMVCTLVGHSRIRDYCFGYHHCARCGVLLGDSLGGAYQDNAAVYPSHLGQGIDGCPCDENAKALTWRDTLYAPALSQSPAAGR